MNCSQPNTLCTFNKNCYLLGSSFIHFLIYEWNDTYDIMLRSTGVSWRYKRFETNRFNRKKLHVPRRTIGITAGYVQYIIHTGLCRVCWLLVFVLWVVWVTEWAIVITLQAAVDPSRDIWFFSSLKCPDKLWNQPASYSKGTGILPWG